MNAEEYRNHKGIGSGTNITTSMLESFADDYHQHKLSEVTEEKIVDILKKL